MTLTECIENHKKIWNWIAEETLKQKRKVEKNEFFKENNIKGEKDNYSFCKYAEQFGKNCLKCPAKRKDIACFNGLLFKWIDENDYKKCADLAKQIANCPLEDWAVKQLEKERAEN